MARTVMGLAERILPIVVINSARDAAPLAEALLDGGIHQVEITLRTEAALESARIMAGFAGLSVGIGTVATSEQVDAAADAGAEFVVSPGVADSVVERAVERDLLSIPGVASPTELMRVTAVGVRLVKLFPAELLGGTQMIAALSGPFPGVRFVPSGGIGPQNLAPYLRHPAVAAVGGSWMVPPELVRTGDFAKITTLCRAAVEAAR